VPGRRYLTEQAATLIRFARVTTDPDIAAGLIDKASDLQSRVEAAEAPSVSPTVTNNKAE
jgi:hypothetical protein